MTLREKTFENILERGENAAKQHLELGCFRRKPKVLL